MNFLATFLAKLFRELLGWGQEQAEKPKEAQDAKTPKDIKDRWNRNVADRLRDKPDGVPRQPE